MESSVSVNSITTSDLFHHLFNSIKSISHMTIGDASVILLKYSTVFSIGVYVGFSWGYKKALLLEENSEKKLDIDNISKIKTTAIDNSSVSMFQLPSKQKNSKDVNLQVPQVSQVQQFDDTTLKFLQNIVDQHNLKELNGPIVLSDKQGKPEKQQSMLPIQPVLNLPPQNGKQQKGQQGRHDMVVFNPPPPLINPNIPQGPRVQLPKQRHNQRVDEIEPMPVYSDHRHANYPHYREEPIITTGRQVHPAHYSPQQPSYNGGRRQEQSLDYDYHY